MSITVEDFAELKREMAEAKKRMNSLEEALAELKASNAHLQGLVSQMTTTKITSNNDGGCVPQRTSVQSRRLTATNNDEYSSHNAMRIVPVSHLSPTQSSLTIHGSSTHFSASANPFRMHRSRRYPYMNSCFVNAIESLPTEIRWKIFYFLAGSIGTMRLVSKSWNAIVNEWLIPENHPGFSVIDVREEDGDCMNVGIEFYKREAACFESLRNFADELDRLPEKPRRLHEWNPVRISFDVSYDGPELVRLRSMIGTNTEQIHITRPSFLRLGGRRFYDAVRKLLEPLNQATQLALWKHCIGNDDAVLLMDLTSRIAIRKMTFTMDVQTHPRDFLHDISGRVDYFSINLQESQGRRDPNIGVRGASWVELILGMFLCGACSIELNNSSIHLFSSEDMERIVEVLVNRSLPFHLKVDLQQQPTRALVRAVKELRKSIKQWDRVWKFNISSKPPPSQVYKFNIYWN